MANTLNFYGDAMCKNPAYAPPVGAVSIVGYWADLSHWIPYTFRSPISGKSVYFANIPYNNNSGIVCSGENMIDFASPETVPTDSNPIITDKISDSGSNIYNALFINKFGGGEDPYKFYGLQFLISNYDASLHTGSFTIRGFEYEQTPNDAEPQQRTEWQYNYGSNYWHPERSHQFTSAIQSRQYSCIKFGRISLGENDYYIFVVGVNASGELNSAVGGTTMLYAVPREFFDAIPKPYVGPVSKDSAAGSFLPTTAYRDSISGRDLTNKRNPVGFNTGNGLRLIQFDNAGYSLMLYMIYSGNSDSLLNYAGQLIDQIAGGNGHRPAEEVQPMTQGVLCCHIVPAITQYGSTIYYLQSISGYRLSLTGIPGRLCMQHIYSYQSPAVSISPRLNSFLDYEPYTSIICHLPFFGDISISPSALYGNAIQAEYELDIYTGILSCNLFIITPQSRYIISTQQAKVSTELPVIGAAANQNAIGTIAQATGGLARARMQSARAQEVGTQAAQAAAGANTAAAALAGAVTTLDALSRAGNAVPVGGSSVEGIGNYLVSRAAYLIITRPQPSLPESFAQLYGAVSNISGSVSSFSGYTEFSAVDLRGIDATEAEKSEILALLRGGVFV